MWTYFIALEIIINLLTYELMNTVCKKFRKKMNIKHQTLTFIHPIRYTMVYDIRNTRRGDGFWRAVQTGLVVDVVGVDEGEGRPRWTPDEVLQVGLRRTSEDRRTDVSLISRDYVDHGVAGEETVPVHLEILFSYVLI